MSDTKKVIRWIEEARDSIGLLEGSTGVMNDIARFLTEALAELQSQPEPREGNVRVIPLTQGKYAIVDTEDWRWLMQWKWQAHCTPEGFWSARRTEKSPNGLLLFVMAREILNVPDGYEVDHINHNDLDNRKCNIRPCTKAQNAHNRKKQAGKSSRYKGVSWKAEKSKWYAQAQQNGKTYSLGYFVNEIEAAKVYDKKIKELRGDFALLNFYKPQEYAPQAIIDRQATKLTAVLKDWQKADADNVELVLKNERLQAKLNNQATEIKDLVCQVVALQAELDEYHDQKETPNE